MSQPQSVLVSNLAKQILTKNPIVKRRTPLWFFTEEYKRSWIQNGCDTENCRNNGSAPKRNQIWECWRKMNPEAKRRYFNMAELDNVRFKEEQAERIAKISYLLGNKQTHKKESYKVEDGEGQINDDYLYCLPKYQRNYDKMVQTKSTRELYKEVIQNLKGPKSNLMADSELVTAVPEDYRSVLARPRRPPPPFVLFACDEKERINDLRRKNQSTSSFFKTAGDEWANAEPEKRAFYEEKYNNLVFEYNRAMLQFKNDNMAEESYLGQASKERRALKKSLRKRLRDCNVLPLNVRNAFNFFLMDHKDVPLIDLTKIWRELPEEAKAKYRMLNREDFIRYRKEKMAFDNFMKQMQVNEGIKESR